MAIPTLSRPGARAHFELLRVGLFHGQGWQPVSSLRFSGWRKPATVAEGTVETSRVPSVELGERIDPGAQVAPISAFQESDSGRMSCRSLPEA